MKFSISLDQFLQYYNEHGKHPELLKSSQFDSNKIIDSLTSNINDSSNQLQSPPPQEVNINDLELDVENLPQCMPPANQEEYENYLMMKKIHHDNFLREVNEKGLRLKNQRTDSTQPPFDSSRSSIEFLRMMGK
ncbi:hypothetical protein MEM_04802 [Candida albicans L26]|uniref:Uncharacterized protein n=1 Tax=Candida albicans TaxID=5476 RepID=A0A8H6C0H4_CANAX|nr:hypothetical protein FOB64_001836 [Candida albicans]KGU05638.1 hypothetical protein MEY_04810 [Candida albicans 19F]KGU06112.1 hypothetical protein MEM_04802 [Candida albicans L26]KHC50519.1 hypothetical protein MGC_04824 [Candida albicans P37039]